jgi:hypothetical protein
VRSERLRERRKTERYWGAIHAWRRRLLDQRTGAAKDVPSPQCVLDDTSKQPPDCSRIRRLGAEQLQSGFGVQDESADRLVDFA